MGVSQNHEKHDTASYVMLGNSTQRHCMPMLTADPFTRAREGNQPRCPSRDEPTMKVNKEILFGRKEKKM